MRGFLATLTSFFCATAMAEWKPPANPDPSTILDEAVADTRVARYPEALAKHLWYHHNALEHDPAQYGVRLSFALGYWQELGQKYPPALDAMRLARDAAEAEIPKDGKDGFHAFHDFQSLNESLGESERTLTKFLELHADDRENAGNVYRLVEADLVKARRFTICNEYVRPERELKANLSSLEVPFKALGIDNPDLEREILADSRKRASVNMARLITILIHNGRDDEATRVADAVRKHLTAETDLSRIDAALETAAR